MDGYLLLDFVFMLLKLFGFLVTLVAALVFVIKICKECCEREERMTPADDLEMERMPPSGPDVV